MAQQYNHGGWYNGKQWNADTQSFGAAGQITVGNSAGQKVSAEVNAQSAAAQGVSTEQFDSFLATQLQAPVTPAYTSGNSGNTAGLQASQEAAKRTFDESIAKQREQTQLKQLQARARETEALQGIDLNTTPFREEMSNKLRDQYGIEGDVQTRLKYGREVLSTYEQVNALIQEQKGVTGLASVRNPRVQKTIDDGVARIGALEAAISAMDGNVGLANNEIDRAVNFIAQDRQDRITYYSSLLSISDRDIRLLDQEDINLAREQRSILEEDLTRIRNTADKVRDMMLNPATAKLVASSGITLNDSLETISVKMGNAQYAEEMREVANNMSMGGYTAVYDPKSVPANQLITVTDGQGKKHYYKKPTTGGGSSQAAIDWLTGQGYTVNPGGVTTNPKKIPTVTPQQLGSLQSIMNQVLAPTITPSAGIGSKTIDPLGRTWIFERTGWRLTN